jgi:hypothetical protein
VRDSCFASLLALSVLFRWRRQTRSWHRGIIAHRLRNSDGGRPTICTKQVFGSDIPKK